MIPAKTQLASAFNRRSLRIKNAVLGAVLANGILVATTIAQTGPRTVSPAAAPSHRPVELQPHARDFYMATLGVDSLALKAVESGLMIRFSYRVVNPEKADPLRDKKINPYLVDERTRRALVIPTLEKVGELRQSGPSEAGKVYWMLFSNKGDFVKTGSRVSLVFGKSHIDGLVVQ
jgi:hypothetical protein